ncbi:MAG: energy-coupled thiamine transporter ThiT [Clostridia bacterium]|nr:energy-coupled thiamine transporter ThiT [Clostridia bacterium]
MNLLFAGAFAETAAETAAETVTEAAEAAAETAASADPTWAQELVEKFTETPGTLWISILVIAALAAIFLAVRKTSNRWGAKAIAYGALCIALSFVLSCLRLFRMPQGGSVTPGSMLPLMLFSAVYGVGPGLLAGLTYGVLQYFQGGWFANFWQFSLDYLLAFAALGLTGLAKYFPKKWGLYLAMAIAALGRALSATLAGIMFWDTAPLASLIYNGTYLIPDTLICMLLALLIGDRLMKLLKSGR